MWGWARCAAFAGEEDSFGRRCSEVPPGGGPGGHWPPLRRLSTRPAAERLIQVRDQVRHVSSTATGTLVINKPTASVTLGSLTQTYTGSPLSATAATAPTGLAVGFTYNGSATPPTAPGSYTVVATVNNANYQGTATGTLVINKVPQTITFTNPGTVVQGGTVALSASATSGLAVTFASQTPLVCTVSGTTASLISPGTCTERCRVSADLMPQLELVARDDSFAIS